MAGQAVHLLGIEHRIPLHEGNLDRIGLAVLAGFGAGEGVGVDDEGAFFAFADLSAQLAWLGR